MSKLMNRVALALLALALTGGMALAADGQKNGQGQGKRNGRQGGEGHQGGPMMDEEQRAKMLAMSSMQCLRFAAETDEGKAALKAFADEVKPVMEGVREKFRAEMEAAREKGATQEEIKAMMEKHRGAGADVEKKLTAARIALLKKLVAIADANQDKLAEQFTEQMKKHMQERRDGGEGGFGGGRGPGGGKRAGGEGGFGGGRGPGGGKRAQGGQGGEVVE